MKSGSMKEMMAAKERIMRGTATPANVWEVRVDGKGGFSRRVNTTCNSPIGLIEPEKQVDRTVVVIQIAVDAGGV